MEPTITHMILGLVQGMSVVMVLAYVLTRTKFFNEVLEKKLTHRNVFFLIVFFGLFSIYGTLAGFNFFGATVNFRDLGPSLAGLVGGPIAGLGAGLIGAFHRVLMSGPTCSSCSLATVLAGLAAGLVYKYRKGEIVSVSQAALFGLAIEALHMAMALILITPLDQPKITWSVRLEIISGSFLPMLAANGLGLAIFILIVRNLIRERKVENAKKMIEGELKVARDIQMGIVPKIFPAYPDRPEFDLFAYLEPANEVGGDLYDFYELDKDHLFFVLGDVSGKGVPASLFMAITVALFKANARAGREARDILMEVNDHLAKDNESCMFVTIFCGILDTRTGEIQCSNAGHNQPIVIQADGTVSYLAAQNTLVAGAMESAIYPNTNLLLYPGDSLLLYTDGVTEAMNKSNELYSEERLAQDLRDLNAPTGREMVLKITEQVKKFAGKAPQSDDMTMLIITYNGCRGTA